jgi:hypothetical protein
MKYEEIKNIINQNNGIKVDIERFDPRFDDYIIDNSFNWCDEYNYYTFEIRQSKDRNLTFIWLPDDDKGDPRGLDYKNGFLFTNVDDFYNFIDEIREEIEE